MASLGSMSKPLRLAIISIQIVEVKLKTRTFQVEIAWLAAQTCWDATQKTATLDCRVKRAKGMSDCEEATGYSVQAAF